MPSKPSTPWVVKDRVLHQSYGPGTIVEINLQRTTIEFDSAGLKKFVTSLVQLEKSDVEAPPPPPKRASRAKSKTAKAAAAKLADGAEPVAAKPPKAAKAKKPKQVKAAS